MATQSEGQLGSETNPCKVGDVDDPQARIVRVVHISDTHLRHERYLNMIPPGDILIHSGDFSQLAVSRWVFREYDYKTEIEEINNFFAKLPHKHKLFVCGNHELNFEREKISRTERRLTNAIYLQDSMVTIEGIKIYGSPWNGLRKSYARGFTAPYEELHRCWDVIPAEQNIDIMVTHSPPGGILDQQMGSDSLGRAVLTKIRPLAHLFGHAHGENGTRQRGGVLFCNAAMRCGGDAKVIDVYKSPLSINTTNTVPVHYGKTDGSGKTCSIM